jgi:hypothetical protein
VKDLWLTPASEMLQTTIAPFSMTKLGCTRLKAAVAYLAVRDRLKVDSGSIFSSAMFHITAFL